MTTASPVSRSICTTALRHGALALIVSATLVGCGSDSADGIKPVQRLRDLPAPENVSVKDVASQVGTETPTRIETHGTAPGTAAPARSPQVPPATSAATDATTQPAANMIQGIPAPPRTNIHQGGNVLAVAGIAFTIPDDWKIVPPSSNLRAAQYAVPGPGGDAEMAVFYFGPGQGGNVEQNVRRWVSQFTPDDNTTTTLGGEVGTLESDSLRVTLVRTEGTYNSGTMGGGDGTLRPGYALFGLVVEGGPEGNIFVKVTGPRSTLQQQRKALEEFARSTRKSNFK